VNVNEHECAVDSRYKQIYSWTYFNTEIEMPVNCLCHSWEIRGNARCRRSLL